MVFYFPRRQSSDCYWVKNWKIEKKKIIATILESIGEASEYYKDVESWDYDARGKGYKFVDLIHPLLVF